MNVVFMQLFKSGHVLVSLTFLTALSKGENVLALRTVQQGERIVRFEKLAPIDKRVTPPLSGRFLKPPTPQVLNRPELPVHSFVVSSAIYDGTHTQLTLSSTGPERKTITCWSNLNWQHLQGIHQFENSWGHFSFILFSRSDSLARLTDLKEAGHQVAIPQIPELLTPFRQSGARYYVTEGTDDTALDFLEAIHELYDDNKRALRKAHQERLKKERDRQRELLLNPRPKPDIIIRFRRVESQKKRHLNGNHKGGFSK